MPFYAPSLHLLPTTPPESDCFDKALIVDDIFHFGELEDDPTCSPPHQCSVLQPKALAHFSSPALSTTSGTSYKTVPLNPATLYPLNPALAVGQALGRGIDAKMNVPVPGTVTAVVAFHTGTLATYAGELSSNIVIWICC